MDYGKDKQGGGIRGNAVILSNQASRSAELCELASACGYTPVQQDWADFESFALNRQDCLLVDLSSDIDQPHDSLSEIRRYLEQHGCTALIWVDADGLEEAFALLPQSQCHFIVDAADVEAVPILTRAFGRNAMDRLYDRNREFGSLHRISDELAEFARTLARMADTDDNGRVSDKPVSFRPAPAGSFQPFPVTSGYSGIVPLAAPTIRDMIKLRRLRDNHFEAGLFADPAWDILLDLMAASLEGQKVSVSSLCIAAAVPPTTALRWITAMTESGLLIREQDPDDARRVFIALAPATEGKMRDYLADVQRRGGYAV